MARRDPLRTHVGPTRPSFVIHEGRRYPLLWTPQGWRLRSKAKTHPADFRTGETNLRIAQAKAREWLERNAAEERGPSKGGGSLETLARVYLAVPKRTKSNVASDNVSRLRVIARKAFGKELSEITCREVGPDFWQSYQREALETAGHQFDLVTRYRENIAINAAVRAARCLFLPVLARHYRTAGLDVAPDAAVAVTLPEPFVPPTTVDEAALMDAWARLRDVDPALWLTIGLARFAGLRREEIANCRVGWIEETNGALSISLRDRPEEKFWTKTGKPYRAQVIDPTISEWLHELRVKPSDAHVIPDPDDYRDRWFERAPQRWLQAHGVKAKKPLHRLRGLYADHIAKLTSDAVTARLAAIRAAQENLGHTTSAVTEKHYLSDALR